MMNDPMEPHNRPQKAFDSWVEPKNLCIPVQLPTLNVFFRRILDYDGTDTRMVEITIPPEVGARRTFRLPSDIFSDKFNEQLGKIPERVD